MVARRHSCGLRENLECFGGTAKGKKSLFTQTVSGKPSHSRLLSSFIPHIHFTRKSCSTCMTRPESRHSSPPPLLPPCSQHLASLAWVFMDPPPRASMLLPLLPSTYSQHSSWSCDNVKSDHATPLLKSSNDPISGSVKANPFRLPQGPTMIGLL